MLEYIAFTCDLTVLGFNRLGDKFRFMIYNIIFGSFIKHVPILDIFACKGSRIL